jgi:hypothetical protein
MSRFVAFAVCCGVSSCVLSFAARSVRGDEWSNHPLNEWVKQSPREGAPAPGLKYEGSGAFDPLARRWIHFGGHDGIPQGFYLFTCDLADGRWRQLFPDTSPPGVCCIDGSNTFDVARGRFLAFPGGSLGHGYQWSRGVKLKQSNVWLYDPQANSWTDMRPPPYKQPEKYSRDIIGRLNSSAAYDPGHEVTYTFGGQGAGGSTNALFVYDAFANHLEQLRPSGDPPAARDGVGLCYDTRHDCLVTFGSQYSSDEVTWLYHPGDNRWEAHQLDPHPPGKKEGTYSTNPKMAYDAAGGVCLCIVRRGEDSGLPGGSLETWALDVGALKWTKLSPKREPDPSASRARNLSYWPEANLFVLESVAGDHSGPQLWTYRYAEAKGDTAAPAPPVELRVTAADGQARLAWRAAASGGAKSYAVYRAPADAPWQAKFERIATTGETSYIDAEFKPGSAVAYRVASVSEGAESPPSATARTQPLPPAAPIVSALSASRVEIDWTRHGDAEFAGYNLYRGVVWVETVLRGEPKAWSDNDPVYSEPLVVSVRDITELRRLNDQPLTETGYVDEAVDLTSKGSPSADYKYAVYAYIVRAVNRLGVESGPSPYALTIPSAPRHVLLRESGGVAEIKWQANSEKSVVGYAVYKLGKSHWDIVRVADELVTDTTFRHEAGKGTTRYWIVPIDKLGQQGEPSSPVWYNHGYPGFFEGQWHQ